MLSMKDFQTKKRNFLIGNKNNGERTYTTKKKSSLRKQNPKLKTKQNAKQNPKLKQNLNQKGGCGCGRTTYRLSGGAEYTQENKQLVNSEKDEQIKDLEEKTASTLNPQEYDAYSKELDQLMTTSPDPRNKLDYEYMFSPLLSEQMQKDAAAVRGKYFVGVNLVKLYSALRNIFSNNETSKEEKDTFKYLGDWVNEYKNYEKRLTDNMGYRNNNSNMILKPEDELRSDATFREVVIASKKYSGLDKFGKITPYGLLKLIKILDKYKKSDQQWLRVATVLEIIYKYLSKGISRDKYFSMKQEIPMHVIFELEEFYTTEHMFLSKEEILEFKNKLDFYKNKNIEKKNNKK